MGRRKEPKKKKKKDAANWKSNYDNYVVVWLNNLPNCIITCLTFIFELVVDPCDAWEYTNIL